METAAAFLESRRLAAMLGATTEFEKEEGITFSSKHNKVSMNARKRALVKQLCAACNSCTTQRHAHPCRVLYMHNKVGAGLAEQ
jgi:hypothetical protein